jgi:hypothetical protein
MTSKVIEICTLVEPLLRSGSRQAKGGTVPEVSTPSSRQQRSPANHAVLTWRVSQAGGVGAPLVDSAGSVTIRGNLSRDDQVMG